ncbi:hypothetical protein THAOC_00341 [Thalassiosira oceanica]|uniref:Uncharacterized protein n=1 Tax=Thalassiosira oceanica TaxID=159749 RepID=K3W4E6_THAOC|nr:hypothetical protein THAOC_00341 [Thalassiosira oceanica]|eukprot:EJK77804.1 hypothetical protein THAOC_00341 [Thalassiosira oceanica]
MVIRIACLSAFASRSFGARGQTDYHSKGARAPEFGQNAPHDAKDVLYNRYLPYKSRSWRNGRGRRPHVRGRVEREEASCGRARPKGQHGADPPLQPDDGHEGPRPVRDARQGAARTCCLLVRRRVRHGRRSSKDDQRAMQGVPSHAQVDEEDDRRARRNLHVQLHSDPEGRQVQGELDERREAQVRRRRWPGRSQVGEGAEAPDRGGAADGQGLRRRGRSRRPGRVRLLRRAPGEDPGLPRPGRCDKEEPLRRAREHQQQQPCSVAASQKLRQRQS